MRSDRPLRVLIVSATVGAGDAGNARELARRLAEGGHEAVIQDFLEAPPLHIGKALCKGYEAELKHAPWAYELAFGIWYWFPFLLAPLARFVSFFTRRRIMGWVRDARADVVVSTYPIATQALGDLRRRARNRWRKRFALRVPVFNVVTDFGYHPFWAHKDVDLNLAVHKSTVEALARRTGRPSVACAPLVGPEFSAGLQRRLFQRARMGLQPGECAVLVSSGSWGVGAVREALRLVAGRRGLVPVVACGRNTALRRQLEHMAREEALRAVVLGWTDDMAGLMAACDVLVENAGGLTSLEAMRAGLPMVSFRPIPGHGRKSAAAMSAAGVSVLASSGKQLVGHLAELAVPGPARQAQLAAAADLFSTDPAVAVAQVGASGLPTRPTLRRPVRVARAASSVALAGAVTWAGLTGGVGVAAAAGALVAHPPAGPSRLVYVGVRLGPLELSNPEVQRQLAQLGATAVIQLNTAEGSRGAVRALVARGINVESGGLGDGPGKDSEPAVPWSLALCDSRSVQELSTLVGEPVGAVVPDHSLSAFDLVDARSAHVMMVVPNATLPVAANGPFPREDLAVPTLEAGHIYLVEGEKVKTDQLLVLLDGLRSQLLDDGLSGAPLSVLQ